MCEKIRGVGKCAMRKVRKFELWLRKYVHRNIYLFVFIAVLCFGLGTVTVWLKLSRIVTTIALFLTATGFIFAVYTIAGVFEQITDIPRVLSLVSELAEETVRKSGTISYICEYPLIGSISLRQTRLYNEHQESLNRFCDVGDGLKAKVYLLTCEKSLMNERLKRYKDYAPEPNKECAVDTALNENDEIATRLKVNYPNNVVRLNVAPHFQAVFTRSRAVIFMELAKFESPMAAPSVEVAGSEETDCPEKAPIPRGDRVTQEVKILGWEVSDPKIINWLEYIRDEYLWQVT